MRIFQKFLVEPDYRNLQAIRGELQAYFSRGASPRTSISEPKRDKIRSYNGAVERSFKELQVRIPLLSRRGYSVTAGWCFSAAIECLDASFFATVEYVARTHSMSCLN